MVPLAGTYRTDPHHHGSSAADMASSIERLTIDLPQGFDPGKHLSALLAKVGEAYGAGFDVDAIDPVARTATVSRQVAITEVQERRVDDSFDLHLPPSVKAGDGDRIAARFADAHEGYTMTAFEPFLGRCTMSRLSDDELRCRGALAVALGVKPWEVGVRSAPDGGFDLTLPRSYVGSKHDDKMDEVATEVVGQQGWYVSIDAKALTARIIPSDPPTFPGAIPFPVESLVSAPRDRVALGQKLGRPGRANEVLWLDFEAAPHVQISGTSGSGKSVSLNAIITGALAGGAELSIIDLPHKALDFFWVKDHCRPAGWGCDSLRAGVASITLTYMEGERRAKVLAERGVTKWTELPPGEQFPPILLLIDEVTGLIQLDDIPKGIPKDHPLVVEAAESNLLRQTLLSYMKKIAAEMRFVGIRMVLSSQVSSVNTGVPTALRMNLANKFLLGSNPTDGNRRLALSDPTSVPKVPENVRRDDKAARGVGVAELEAREPCVFKSYFASVEQLRSGLDRLGLPLTVDPAPTPVQIARYTPSLDDLDEAPPNGGAARDRGGECSPVSGRLASEIRAEMGDDWDVGEDGTRLSGYERANAARHESAKVRNAQAAAPGGHEDY